MYPTVAGSIFFTLEVLVLLAVLRDADDKIPNIEFLTALFILILNLIYYLFYIFASKLSFLFALPLMAFKLYVILIKLPSM